MNEAEIPALATMIETALARGETKAIRYRGIWYNWEWLRQVASRIEALLQSAGVGPDMAVAIAPANRPACAAALLGLIAARRDVVMIYAYQSPEAIARKIADLNCAAVLAQDSSWTDATRSATAAAGAVGLSLSEEAQEIVPGTQVDPAVKHLAAGENRGLYLLTSGTTGPPKLRHLDYTVAQRSMIFESAMHPYGAPAPASPAAHYGAFGNITGLYSWLPLVVANRPIIMSEKFTLDDYLAYLREFRPAHAGMPPSAFRELLDRNEPPETFAGVRFMSAGASAMDADLQRAVEEKYNVKILHAYGATEFGGVVSTVTPQHIEEFGPEKSFSVGRPIGGAEFRIVDPETGETLPPNRPGILHVKVPRVGPDWMPTSDLAKLDEDGFLYYVGRHDGAIVRGGFKIAPETIRAALLEHPAIFDAIVAGAPDRRLGEVPVAAYVVRTGKPAPTVDELKAHLRARLPATFLPTGYREVAVLPLTPTNKYDLASVRAMFESEG